jgi:hypothetical protein
VALEGKHAPPLEQRRFTVDWPRRKHWLGWLDIFGEDAAGDFHVLAVRGRRILRAHIAGDVDRAIAAIAEATRRALE